jgi:hypothetical protein
MELCKVGDQGSDREDSHPGQRHALNLALVNIVSPVWEEPMSILPTEPAATAVNR